MNFDDYNEIVRQWIKGVQDNYRKDAELTLKYCNDIISYGSRLDDHKLMGFGYFYITETYYCLNDGENFFTTVPNALEHLEKSQEWEYIARCYNLLGIISTNRGNLPIAYDYYLNGIMYCEKYNLPEVKVIICNNCGALNFQSKRYSEGMMYLQDSLDYVERHPELEDYQARMICLYENIALCKVMEGDFQEVEEIFEKIHANHWQYADYLDKIGCLIAESIYYHKSGQADRRDECILEIDGCVSESIAFMDMVNDYFMYAEMLLECDKDKEFWHILDALEPMIRSFKITYMHLQEISLKIKYYRKRGKNAEFLQAAGLYYELSERREKETQTMMGNVLNLRNNLENAKREQQKIQEQNVQLTEKSERDALTQLANRAKLKRDAEEAYNYALAKKQYLAVEILDIDYFKEYNDNYGHQAGDEGIKTVVACIRELSDEYGAIAARYGGDEFVIVYSCTNPLEVAGYAQELKQMVLDRKIEHNFSKAENIITISQGICCDIPTSSQTVWDFLTEADNMLYKIKKQARNNYGIGDAYGKIIVNSAMEE